VPSDVAPGYAPEGRSLISVTVLGIPAEDDAALLARVRYELAGWYDSPTVESWRHLRTYRIPWAQPDQTPPALEPVERAVKLDNGLFVAGDHRETSSIHGALGSGLRAARAVLAS
jgi:predicted NAD/FAD-dependent oxidoreductase